MSDKAEKQAITKAEVINAMETIRDWCDRRNALDDPCDKCPMDTNCTDRVKTLPDRWEIEE